MTTTTSRLLPRIRASRGLHFVRQFPATTALGVVTLAFFALQAALGGTTDDAVATRLGALRPDRVGEQLEMYRLVMSMFLHLGPVHFLLNAMAFAQLALLVEYIWGGTRLLVYYLLCGIGAALVTAVASPYALPSVGASGALMGLAGLLLGARYMGTPALRLFLGEVLGRRLFWGVLFTFVVGLVLETFWPEVSSWGHLGGFLAGLLLAAATPDADSGEGQVLVAGGILVPVVLGAGLWMTVDGDRALDTLDADTAWALRVKATDFRGSLAATGLLVHMLDRYEAAGDLATGQEAFRREIEAFDDPVVVQWLLATIYEEGKRADETLWVLERWVALAPDEGVALNALAWQLVVHPTPDRRDPRRAEGLVRMALESLGEDPDPTSRAAYLDTLAEALSQQGRVAEALEAQRESVALAREEGMADLEAMEDRLTRLEGAGR